MFPNHTLPTISGRTIRTELWYPRTSTTPDRVSVELMDVRAANSIYIQYDFDRDGWAITMPLLDLVEDSTGAWHEVEKEVGFIPAWASGEPRE